MIIVRRSLAQRGSTKQNGYFPCKFELHLKKVCYKISLCDNRQRQSCRAFSVLTIRAKMIRGDAPYYVNKMLSCRRDRAAGCVIVFAKSKRLELADNILWTL